MSGKEHSTCIPQGCLLFLLLLQQYDFFDSCFTTSSRFPSESPEELHQIKDGAAPPARTEVLNSGSKSCFQTKLQPFLWNTQEPISFDPGDGRQENEHSADLQPLFC